MCVCGGGEQNEKAWKKHMQVFQTFLLLYYAADPALLTDLANQTTMSGKNSLLQTPLVKKK